MIKVFSSLWKRLFRKPPFKPGQFANWQAQGVIQWSHPRRIVHIEFSHGRWFAWCDGSMTAIPANELLLCD